MECVLERDEFSDRCQFHAWKELLFELQFCFRRQIPSVAKLGVIFILKNEMTDNPRREPNVEGVEIGEHSWFRVASHLMYKLLDGMLLPF